MWQDNVIEKHQNNLYKQFEVNNIINTDSYKLSHYALYPEGTNAMYSYIEPRINGVEVVPFGLQMYIKNVLSKPITAYDINVAEDLATKHGLPFNRSGWEYILKTYAGLLPVVVSGVPEGMVVDSHTAIASVFCDDPVVFWLSSYIETSIQRAIWYPTTIATNDRMIYKQLKWFYEHGSDNPIMLDFSLHSFGSRGVSSSESAIIGGLAHMVYFKGTDDFISLAAARDFYDCDMSGYSVCATEHSIQCSYGYDDQKTYLNRVLDVYGKRGSIVSVVMDGYNIFREVDLLCSPYFVNRVRDSGCKFVVRPDSGDMYQIIPVLLDKLHKSYGSTINSKGKRVLNNVGIIQGDGINQMSVGMLAQIVHDHGYAPECVIYGSGGSLLQGVNRDTFKFAQKTSAIRVGDTWRETVKNPITDPWKKSRGGIVDTKDFVVYYDRGVIKRHETLDMIRERAKIE